MTDQSASTFQVTPYTANGVIANTDLAHVRTQPIVSSTTLIADFPGGTHVWITGTVHLPTGQYQDWYQITFTGITNGAAALQTISGFVVKQYVTETPASTTTSTTTSTFKTTTTSTDVVLTVPWFSQLYPNAYYEACGPTSVLELLHGYGTGKLKVLQDWVTMGLWPGLGGKTGTGPQTMINLAAKAGPLALTLVNPAPTPATLPAMLRASLAKRVPAIVLVDYLKLKTAPFNKTPYLNPAATVVDHWWVVVGTAGDDFIVNDSLWKPTDNAGRGGFNLQVPSALMQAAFHDNLFVLIPTNPLP